MVLDPNRIAASEWIEQQRETLAAQITTAHFDAHPELDQRYGGIGRQKCQQDTVFHLHYLGNAIRTGSLLIFFEYLAWARVMLASRKVPPDDLLAHLRTMRAVLLAQMPGELSPSPLEFLDRGIEKLPSFSEEVPTFVPPGSLSEAYLKALLSGSRMEASRLVRQAFDEGMPLERIYLEVFEPSQREIGRLWQLNRITVAQEHFCTAATQMIMSQLYPMLFERAESGKVMVGTCVGNELHEIGIRMVCDLFEIAGWQTYYLGANVPETSIVQTVLDVGAHVIAISATISYHVRTVEQLIARLRSTPGLERLRILVGGYPFNLDPDLWKQVDADGSASSAREALEIANRLTDTNDEIAGSSV